LKCKSTLVSCYVQAGWFNQCSYGPGDGSASVIVGLSEDSVSVPMGRRDGSINVSVVFRDDSFDVVVGLMYGSM